MNLLKFSSEGAMVPLIALGGQSTCLSLNDCMQENASEQAPNVQETSEDGKGTQDPNNSAPSRGMLKQYGAEAYHRGLEEIGTPSSQAITAKLASLQQELATLSQLELDARQMLTRERQVLPSFL